MVLHAHLQITETRQSATHIHINQKQIQYKTLLTKSRFGSDRLRRITRLTGPSLIDGHQPELILLPFYQVRDLGLCHLPCHAGCFVPQWAALESLFYDVAHDWGSPIFLRGLPLQLDEVRIPVGSDWRVGFVGWIWKDGICGCEMSFLGDFVLFWEVVFILN